MTILHLIQMKDVNLDLIEDAIEIIIEEMMILEIVVQEIMIDLTAAHATLVQETIGLIVVREKREMIDLREVQDQSEVIVLKEVLDQIAASLIGQDLTIDHDMVSVVHLVLSEVSEEIQMIEARDAQKAVALEIEGQMREGAVGASADEVASLQRPS